MTELERIQRKIQRLIATREKDIELFARQIFINIKEAFQRIQRDLELIEPGAIEAAARVNRLEAVLQENGFNREFRQIQALYANEIEAIRELTETLTELGVYSGAAIIDVGGIDTRSIQALVNLNVQPITKTLNSLNVDFKTEMFRSIVTGQGVDLSAITDRLTDKYYNYVRTELNTNMAVFNREVNGLAAAEAGLDIYLYIGPLDGVTRPFCRDLLTRGNPVYTLDQIRDLSRREGRDVFTLAGGYNCRHEWIPISKEYAASLGFNG